MMPIDISTTCYHWLICLSLFFSNSPEISNIDPQVAGAFFNRSVQLAWVEYDRGFNQLCPQSKVNQTQRRRCSESAKKGLRNWLDKQAENCLKTPIPRETITNRGCRPAADAVFSYVVRFREGN